MAYDLGQWLVTVFGYNAILACPALLSVVALVFQVRSFKLDLVLVAAFFSIGPLLTPLIAEILGYEYFTAKNYNLQFDENLKAAAIIILSLFTVALMLGGGVKAKPAGEWTGTRVRFSKGVLFIVFLTNFLLLFTFLEPDLIINRGYGEIKEESAPYSSFVNQFFNVCVSVFFAYLGGRDRRRIVFVVYFAFILLALLMARRTLAIGLLFAMIYSQGDEKFSNKQVFFGIGAILLLWFLGEARAVGLTQYLFSGARPPDREYLTLPGGAANIFLGTMGVIDLVDSGKLDFPETMPILLWPFGEAEWTIYPKHGYEYNGGMHLANTLYWNFGFMGVLFGGYLFGKICRAADSQIRKIAYESGGTLPGMLSISFVLTIPNTMWFSVTGIMKLALAVSLAYLLAVGAQRERVGNAKVKGG